MASGHVVAFISPARFFMAGQNVRVSVRSSKRISQNVFDAISASTATEYPIIFTTSAMDDRNWSHCQDLAQRMSAAYPNADVRLFRPTSLRDLTQVISGAKVCISTLLHPLILATMLRVPGVGIATNAKTIDFMSEFGQGDRALPLHWLEHDWHDLSKLISSALNLPDGGLALLESQALRGKKAAIKTLS
jgi:polysaccharide pyruvyl transferase WcaK-like protein